MTIEQALDLCENHIEKLKAMSNEELYKEFAPYLAVTRPDMAATQRAAEKKTITKKRGDEDGVDYDEVAAIAKQFGLNLKL